jgi:dihydropteroate synthase
LDPGFGFAKTPEQNLALVRNLEALTCGTYPVLLAASRKGTIGKVLGGVPAEERLEGTLATTARAVEAGAALVRVHDVQAQVRFIKMLTAIIKGRVEV